MAEEKKSEAEVVELSEQDLDQVAGGFTSDVLNLSKPKHNDQPHGGKHFNSDLTVG